MTRRADSADPALTPKAVAALRLLVGTSINDTRSAKALAQLLWPERLKACGTSLRRGGLYRAAGAYYSTLQRRGLVGHWMDDFSSGYFLTAKGAQALAGHTSCTPMPNPLAPVKDKFRPVHWSNIETGEIIGWGIERKAAGEPRYKPVGINGEVCPFA